MTKLLEQALRQVEQLSPTDQDAAGAALIDYLAHRDHTRLSDEQLAEYYRACDVFVLPGQAVAREATCVGEGFGRVYVEAALAGKPVVGSSGGGAPEAVLNGKTGLLVEPPSADRTAAAIIQLLENPTVATQMGGAGQQWALENFTVETLRRRLEKLLRL